MQRAILFGGFIGGAVIGAIILRFETTASVSTAVPIIASADENAVSSGPAFVGSASTQTGSNTFRNEPQVLALNAQRPRDTFQNYAARYAAANGGGMSLREYSMLAQSYAMTQGGLMPGEGGGYQASSGTQYRYDLNNPADRVRYGADAIAQTQDSANPRVQMDREMGQYGGGAAR